PLPPQPRYNGEDSQDDGGDVKTTTDNHGGGDDNTKMITAAAATAKTVKTWQQREDNHSSGEDEHGGDDDMRMIAAAAATAKTVKTVAAMQGRPQQWRRRREDDGGGDDDDMKMTMAAATTALTIKMARQQHEDDHGDDVDHAKMIMVVVTMVKTVKMAAARMNWDGKAGCRNVRELTMLKRLGVKLGQVGTSWLCARSSTRGSGGGSTTGAALLSVAVTGVDVGTSTVDDTDDPSLTGVASESVNAVMLCVVVGVAVESSEVDDVESCGGGCTITQGGIEASGSANEFDVRSRDSDSVRSVAGDRVPQYSSCWTDAVSEMDETKSSDDGEWGEVDAFSGVASLSLSAVYVLESIERTGTSSEARIMCGDDAEGNWIRGKESGCEGSVEVKRGVKRRRRMVTWKKENGDKESNQLKERGRRGNAGGVDKAH
ncbi:hypothetical protein EDB85DRAFT_1892933, partial [Lactarius pseudohatsudake]